MSKQYSQFKAMMAVTKASLTSTFRSPQAIFFSLLVPMLLIWIFGSLGRDGGLSIDVAFEQNADSTLPIYQRLKANSVLDFADRSKRNVEDDLIKGRLAAIIDVQQSPDSTLAPYRIHLRTSSAAQREFGMLRFVLQNTIDETTRSTYPEQKTVATVSQSVVPGRLYRQIDFVLPGMIGFSLIGAAVFGIAFAFYNLRDTLVLKRMYSTPINRQYIILGESLSRVIFQLVSVAVLILFGTLLYHFTLANGWITLVNMMLLSGLALLVFLGFGFFIASVSKNQNIIPIYANLFMFPQYFLSGTFFSKNALPQFLQPLIQALPLTVFNDAMRNVAFEGTSLFSCWPQILTLTIWGIIIYAATAKVFRWE